MGHSLEPSIEALDKILFTIENSSAHGFIMNFNHPHNHRLFNSLNYQLAFNSQTPSQTITIGDFEYNFSFHPEKTEVKRFLPNIVGDDKPTLIFYEKSGEKKLFNYKPVINFNYEEFIFIYKLEVWYKKVQKSKSHQPKTRQHFLPKVYLKGFSEGGKVSVKNLDNKYDKSIREYSLESSLFWSEFLYSFSEEDLEIEDWLGSEIEGKSEPILNYLDKKPFEFLITKDFKRTLASFFAVQKIRMPQNVLLWKGDITKQLSMHTNQEWEVINKEQSKELFAANLKGKFEGLLSSYANDMARKHWRILVSLDAAAEFITSDNPLMTSLNTIVRTHQSDIENNDTLKYYFPVNKRAFVIIDNELPSDEIALIKEEDEIQEINKFTISKSSKMILGNNEVQIDELSKGFHAVI